MWPNSQDLLTNGLHENATATVSTNIVAVGLS